MSEYQQFVKQAMRQMAGSNLTPQQKMKRIGVEWRKSGRATTKKRATRKPATRKRKTGGALGLQGGAAKSRKTRKPATRKRKGGAMGLQGGAALGLYGGSGHIQLDNGVVLHPDMLGSGFWQRFQHTFAKPIKAVNKAARSPFGKLALTALPFML